MDLCKLWQKKLEAIQITNFRQFLRGRIKTGGSQLKNLSASYNRRGYFSWPGRDETLRFLVLFEEAQQLHHVLNRLLSSVGKPASADGAAGQWLFATRK